MLHFITTNKPTRQKFILIRAIARISGHKLAQYYIDNMYEIRVDALNNLLSNNSIIKNQPVSQKELETLLDVPFFTIKIENIFSNNVLNYKQLGKILGYTTSTSKNAGVYI